MDKTLYIEGMNCNHCKMRVEKALNKLDGVTAEVDLDNKLAKVTLSKEYDDKALINAVEDVGYDVVDIK
ncbi:MAG TPA: heavy-metal-associated domain-containing protein [Acholeplasmataceae bacterium]|nr:heavy-metal-associated domain-containing protein [Acholeplasmataceae bacterium]